eukprot:401903-Prymnesium_polylepis.1
MAVRKCHASPCPAARGQEICPTRSARVVRQTSCPCRPRGAGSPFASSSSPRLGTRAPEEPSSTE